MASPFAAMDRATAARDQAAEFERSLDAIRRKQLGQFFTGLPLARLLAVVANRLPVERVLDPMAGHGDLLDAVLETATKHGLSAQQIEGVEYDELTASACRERLRILCESSSNTALVHSGNAFSPETTRRLSATNYDLVITNPPYVRYQLLSQEKGFEYPQPRQIRAGLIDTIEERTAPNERPAWLSLARGYSGLSDLSVPSWLLAGVLVRPGGTLALVAPETWRSRKYGEIIRYFLARCFRLDYVIEDTQPGWFPDVLVRTTLVIATRLSPEDISVPLSDRGISTANTIWVQVAPDTRSADSLVGGIFKTEEPDESFSNWLRSAGGRGEPAEIPGLRFFVRAVAKQENEILQLARKTAWGKSAEYRSSAGPSLFVMGDQDDVRMPDALRDILGCDDDIQLIRLEDSGMNVSQGLRTGCNGFFYVTWLADIDPEVSMVRTSELLGTMEVRVPRDVLRPVIRRQDDLESFRRGLIPPGRVLDLRAYALPEDAAGLGHTPNFSDCGGPSAPKILKGELAELVRRAATTRITDGANARLVPELSAVRTNVRLENVRTKQIPRFWYMLPDFTRRHSPDIFIPRINQLTPWADSNETHALLVDANFSTLWRGPKAPTVPAMRAVLNSTWCRACMEAIGTRMGGGALKLEAVHLKSLPWPVVSDEAAGELARLGSSLAQEDIETRKRIDHVIVSSLSKKFNERLTIEKTARKLREKMDALCRDRQK